MSKANQDQAADPHTLTKDLSESVQKEILPMVTQQSQESGLSLISQELMRKMQADAANGPAPEAVKADHMQHTWRCTNCGHYPNTGKFCTMCGGREGCQEE